MLLPCRRNRVPRRNGTGRITTFRSFELQARELKEGPINPGKVVDAGAGLLAASPAPQPLQEQDANHQPLLLSPSPLKAAAPVQPTLHEQARPWHAKGTGRRPVRRSFHLDSSQLVQAAVELLTDDRGEQAAEAAALLHAAAASLMNSQQWGQQLLAGAGTPVASGGGMRSPLLAGIGTPASLRRGAALLLAGSPLQPQQLMRDSAQQAAPHQQSVTPLLLQVQMQLAAGAAGSTLSNRSRRSSTSRMATPHAAASDGLRSALSYPFTPVEGIPERSFARQPPATVLRTATPGAVAFTPLEGVPETQRGFARTPAAPRFAFTPMEGVPEKASLGITPVVRPMRLAHATFAATAAAPLAAAAALMLHRDDFDDDDDGGDYCDGGEGGQPYVAGRPADDSVQTPSHMLRLNMAGGATRSQVTTEQPGVEGAQQQEASVEGPRPDPALQLTPRAVTHSQSAGAAASLDVGGDGAVTPRSPSAAGPSQRASKRPAATPREMRTMKKRKSLAGDGLAMDEMGMRRTTRVSHKPLEYWRNEYKEFGREKQSLPTVARYVERTPDPVWPHPGDKMPEKKKARSCAGGSKRTKQ